MELSFPDIEFLGKLKNGFRASGPRRVPSLLVQLHAPPCIHGFCLIINQQATIPTRLTF